MKHFLFYFFGIIFLLGCKKDISETELGYSYFPIEEGHFVEYQVEEIFHDIDLIPQHDTVRYRLKTLIGEDVIDNAGRNARKFFQYKYDLENNNLLSLRVWTCVIDGKRGEIVEENQRKIRITFPLKKGNEWNVNAFNTGEEQRVYYEDAGTERILNGEKFEKTAKIWYDDFLTLVDYKKKHEIYADGIGLMERSFKDLTIQNFDTLDIKKGTELHYKMINFGKE